MSDSQQEWTDAEMVQRCCTGDETAWKRLILLFRSVLPRCVARYHRRDVHLHPDLLEIAAQNVLCRLWLKRNELLAEFHRQTKTLETYLTRLVCRQVDELLRRNRRRRQRHQKAAAERDEPRSGPGLLEERAEKLLPRLHGPMRTLLEELLSRTFSDGKQKPSKGALRQLVHRIRQKLKELEAEDGGREGEPPPAEG